MFPVAAGDLLSSPHLFKQIAALKLEGDMENQRRSLFYARMNSGKNDKCSTLW